MSVAAETTQSFVLDAVRSWATSSALPTAPPGADWIETAASAGVLATVGDALMMAGDAAAADLRTARLHAATTSMRVMGELESVGNALADLRWLVLKGPVLADLIYRRKSSRTYDDLDILVHPADLANALPALQAYGFDLIDRNWPMVERMRRGEISLASPGGMNLDLHWHPINDARSREQLAVDVDLMFRDSVSVDVNGRAVPSLSPADLVVYVALHGCLSGGHLLRWLLDLQQAVRWSTCPPDELAARARRHNLSLVLRVMLERAAQYVDPSLAPYAEAACKTTAWVRAARMVSRREPPTPSSEGHRRTGRSVFGATRSTTLTSARQLATDVARDRRERIQGKSKNTVDDLHASLGSPTSRDAWLASAAAYRP